MRLISASCACALCLCWLALGATADDTLPIPATARGVRFDGQRLRIAAVESWEAFVAPRLYIPRGRHLVTWAADEDSRVVVSPRHYAAAYRKRRARLASEADKGRGALLAELAKGYGFPDEAAVPHLLGNWHWGHGDKGAATRWWRRAVLQNPAFAPSHLNLALAAAEAGDKGVAVRELLLARAFNLGDGFGLDPAIDALAAKHELDMAGGTTLRAEFYALARAEPEAPLDRRMARFHDGIGLHFPRREERAKLQSNLGLYFAGKNKPVRARAAFRRALTELVRAGKSLEGYGIAAVVFDNLARSCRQSGWAGEADDFERMAKLARELR